MRKQHYLGVLVFGAFAVLLAVAFLRQPAGPAFAEGVTQITASSEHTCAVMTSGSVRCWGNNEWGALGSGVPVPPRPPTPTPTPTPFVSTLPVHVCEDSACDFALDDVTEIAAGGDASARGHTCALTASGNVWCWGMNDIGQLGNGEGGSADDYSAAPVEVCKVYGTSSCTTPLDNIVSVAGVNNHTCAVDTVSRVYCWGQNEQEQLGNPEIDEVCQTRSGPSILDYDCSRVAFPVCVAATGDTCDIELDGVTVVAPGGTHTCAYIAADSQAKCWGDNVWSALGAGLAGGPGAAEYDFAIDVCDEDGTWDDMAGECQDAEGFPSPLTNVKGIASGAYHSCALVDAPPAGTNYEVKCWGWNACGQLGNNEEEDGINYCGIFRHSKDQNRPVSVCEDWGMSSCTTELDNVEALAAGLGHTCALMNGGTVKCWGWNKYGQLGDGHDGDTGHDLADTVVCVAGKAGTCVALDGVARIAAALGHSCAVQDDNRAQCWGDNRSQQLGYDTGIETYSEHAAPVTGITIIAAGTPDYDGDGCSDAAENQTANASQNTGGLRNPKYFWDFYDVWTHPLNQPLAWERNKVINNQDRFGVLGRFGPGPTPVSEDASRAAALETPVSGSGYHAAFDRGPKIGPNAWDRAPADGTINIPDDVIGVSLQFGHSCAPTPTPTP